MWFKNLKLYRFTRPFRMTPEQFSEHLEKRAFAACGRLEESSFGFVPPIGGPGAPLVHPVNGCFLFASCREDKLLPNAVVREAAAEKLEGMEAERGAPVPRRERDRVMDQVRFEMLPRAFSRSQRTYAYIDPDIGYLVVDISSDTRADEFTANLQTALGALPVTFPATLTRPASALTDWVANASMPDDIELERECELAFPGEGGAVVRCRNQELASREVFTHLESGKEVVKIAVTYGDRLRFVLDDKLNVRRLKFLEIIRDEVADVDAPDAASRLDLDFAVASLELRAFIERLMEIFGGEDLATMGVED